MIYMIFMVTKLFNSSGTDNFALSIATTICFTLISSTTRSNKYFYKALYTGKEVSVKTSFLFEGAYLQNTDVDSG